MNFEPPEAAETLTLAVVFGLVSIPWTYAFVAELSLPLWPSFVAAATFYAAGGGPEGWATGLAGNLAGLLYPALTIGLVEGMLGGGVLALSLVVGGFHVSREPPSVCPAARFRAGRFLRLRGHVRRPCRRSGLSFRAFREKSSRPASPC